MVTYDIRGHGASDKPLEPERYKDAKLWADEVKAVIDDVGLRRPVLVGWSYAGRIICDYLRHHGQGRLAGINFVGAVTKSDPSFFGETLRRDQPRMMSEDLATSIAGTRDFVRTVSGKPMGLDEFEMVLAFNMIVPPKVRAGLGGREANYEGVLYALKIPVLVTQGVEDRLILVAAARYTASVVPNEKLSLYEAIGHAPFFEDPARFNKELAEFVNAAATP
jgi:non-heme chloroperoxidase